LARQRTDKMFMKKQDEELSEWMATREEPHHDYE